MYYEYFPEAFIQLQLEIAHHPLLVQRLQKHIMTLTLEGKPDEVGTIFAEICHYCGVAINGEFDGEQLEALADVLLNKLLLMKVKEALPASALAPYDWGKFLPPDKMH